MTDILLTVSDPSVLLTPGTPQFNARNWLLELDTFKSCPQDTLFVQRYVLAVFYFSTRGDSWRQCNAPSDFSDTIEIEQANSDCTIMSNGYDPHRVSTIQGLDAWLSSSHECSWGGLACDSTTSRVDRIEFENNGLAGTLPFELQELTDLRFLIAEEGRTTGSIPSEYGTLSNLIVMDLNYNHLTGVLPEEIYRMSNLAQLDLNDNFLSGTISSSIGEFQDLRLLQIDKNLFSGTIPDTIGLLEKLEILDMFGNLFEGAMPNSICQNRDIRGGSITDLTVNCDEFCFPKVECTVPECCTRCPFW